MLAILENFEFVDIQRAHLETFGKNPMIFPAKTTDHNKIMAEKELYAFSELCIFYVFIHIIRKKKFITDNVDNSSSTQEVGQSIKNSKQEWKVGNGKAVRLTPDILFEKYLALSICLLYNASLWHIILCTVYFTALT